MDFHAFTSPTATISAAPLQPQQLVIPNVTQQQQQQPQQPQQQTASTSTNNAAAQPTNRRSKRGCLNCRERKKKCGEDFQWWSDGQWSCSSCHYRGESCRRPPPPRNRGGGATTAAAAAAASRASVSGNIATATSPPWHIPSSSTSSSYDSRVSMPFASPPLPDTSAHTTAPSTGFAHPSSVFAPDGSASLISNFLQPPGLSLDDFFEDLLSLTGPMLQTPGSQKSFTSPIADPFSSIVPPTTQPQSQSQASPPITTMGHSSYKDTMRSPLPLMSPTQQHSNKMLPPGVGIDSSNKQAHSRQGPSSSSSAAAAAAAGSSHAQPSSKPTPTPWAESVIARTVQSDSLDDLLTRWAPIYELYIHAIIDASEPVGGDSKSGPGTRTSGSGGVNGNFPRSKSIMEHLMDITRTSEICKASVVACCLSYRDVMVKETTSSRSKSSGRRKKPVSNFVKYLAKGRKRSATFGSYRDAVSSTPYNAASYASPSTRNASTSQFAHAWLNFALNGFRKSRDSLSVPAKLLTLLNLRFACMCLLGAKECFNLAPDVHDVLTELKVDIRYLETNWHEGTPLAFIVLSLAAANIMDCALVKGRRCAILDSPPYTSSSSTSTSQTTTMTTSTSNVGGVDLVTSTTPMSGGPNVDSPPSPPMSPHRQRESAMTASSPGSLLAQDAASNPHAKYRYVTGLSLGLLKCIRRITNLGADVSSGQITLRGDIGRLAEEIRLEILSAQAEPILSAATTDGFDDEDSSMRLRSFTLHEMWRQAVLIHYYQDVHRLGPLHNRIQNCLSQVLKMSKVLKTTDEVGRGGGSGSGSGSGMMRSGGFEGRQKRRKRWGASEVDGDEYDGGNVGPHLRGPYGADETSAYESDLSSSSDVSSSLESGGDGDDRGHEEEEDDEGDDNDDDDGEDGNGSMRSQFSSISYGGSTSSHLPPSTTKLDTWDTSFIWFLCSLVSLTPTVRSTCYSNLESIGCERAILDNLKAVRAVWREMDQTGRAREWKDVLGEQGLVPCYTF